VLGGLALAGFLKPTSHRLILNGCVFAAFLVLLGLAPTLGVAYVLLFGVGAFSVTFRATATALLQLYADPQMRGRVISLLVLATAGTTPFGGPLVGWICEHASPRVACVVGGLATALAALACVVYLQVKRSALDEERDEVARDYESATSRSSDASAAKMACRSSSESRPT
jgi:MFS family permease